MTDAVEHPIALVTLTSTAGLRGEVRAGRHHLVVDERPSVGGEDGGPDPYQLVLAGLVQCTSATLRLYAARKGWELGEVRVRAQLLRTGEGADKVERIERSIRFGADLPDEQRSRLAEIAERTPVTRTLRAGVGIHTVLD